MHNCFDIDSCGSGQCEKFSQALDFARLQLQHAKQTVVDVQSDDLISIAHETLLRFTNIVAELQSRVGRRQIPLEVSCLRRSNVKRFRS
jgi:hypothetical protein